MAGLVWWMAFELGLELVVERLAGRLRIRYNRANRENSADSAGDENLSFDRVVRLVHVPSLQYVVVSSPSAHPSSSSGLPPPPSPPTTPTDQPMYPHSSSPQPHPPSSRLPSSSSSLSSPTPHVQPAPYAANSTNPHHSAPTAIAPHSKSVPDP